MKRNSLLTADWHLTDTPLEEYRWAIFDRLKEVAFANNVHDIYILGDICDRKDRHSGALVNRMVGELELLQEETGADVTIPSGNHDTPINGPYYWDFLNSRGIQYIRTPKLRHGIYILPYTDSPMDDWRDLDFQGVNAIFMHQTVSGSMLNNDRRVTNAPHPMPIFPRGVPVFSGDVHHPQVVGNVIYIGAPHPVDFNETWQNRIILVRSDDFKHPEDIKVQGTRRAIVTISHSSELEKTDYRKNDQIRIRYTLTGDKLTQWSIEELEIKKWADSRGVIIASTEAVLVGDGFRPEKQEKSASIETLPPEDIVRTYGTDEKLSSELIEFGVGIVRGI